MELINKSRTIFYSFRRLKLFYPVDKIPIIQDMSALRGDKVEILIVLHLYYIEFIDEIINYLKNIRENYDLYISVSDFSHLDNVNGKFKDVGKNRVVFFHPNRGRDIGPFLTLLNQNNFDGYKYVCKIHAKGSKYSNLGSIWRNDLLTELLGSRERVASILSALREETNIGLVGPAGHRLVSDRYWGENRSSVIDLSRRMGIPKSKVFLDFFAGSMFWFKPSAIQPIKNLGLTINNIENENGQRDGTVAHAIERLFNLVVYSTGHICTHSDKPYASAIVNDDSENRVIVLNEA